MALGIYQQNKRQEKAQKAIALYKQGYTFREIAKVLSVSHEWVRQAYLSSVNNLIDKN